MAQKVVTLLTDDITGKEIPEGEGETIDFAFQGYTYSIDLDTKNSRKFHEAMSSYIEHARRTGKVNVVPLRRSGDARRSASDVDPAQVRAWAEENGYDVSPRGRIKAEIVEAFKAAQA
ncbi:MAG: hypothetical protein QG622_790 [Actinomycetota bacterium]|nr:hypothetical protein [Actinomycetota bacterium]